MEKMMLFFLLPSLFSGVAISLVFILHLIIGRGIQRLITGRQEKAEYE